MSAPDIRTTEELCQPTMNGRGGPIVPVNTQATDFGLKNHMIQQVQNNCQFYGLPGDDDANKHLDKFLTIIQSMKQNEVTDDALRLYLFPYSLTHYATACWGTFMKRRPKECYDLIENITAYHNDWDTLAHGGDSSSSITSSSSEIAALTQQMAEMRKDTLQMYLSNQQVSSVTPSCETCGGPHSYFKCQAAGGYTQDVYATTGNYNLGATSVIEIKKSLQETSQGALPSNTVPNAREEIKEITTRSGILLAKPLVPLPPISSSYKEVERDPKTITDHVLSEDTTRVPCLVVQPCSTLRSGWQRNIEYPRALLHRSIAQDMRTTTKRVV
nr:reverse transcriptase domain-containing protein [Tanacetum cinerariifolium]GEY18799.1 reverse transcriptase domain-containing protein [Tanacetum cinerariifolium]